MFGDGSLSRTEGSILITITGNKVDDENYLLGHVRPLFLKVFDIELTSRYRPDENTMDLYRHSKRIASTLHSWGMPLGLKKLESLTPKTEVAAIPFIKGIFDTDGSVYRKYGPYAQIQFKTVSKSLMRFVRDHLEALGFHPTRLRPDETKFRFSLSRQSEVDAFFRIVSPMNPKHLRRLKRIRRPELPAANGQTPSHARFYSENFPLVDLVGSGQELMAGPVRGRSLARDDTEHGNRCKNVVGSA
jgi:intein/homing endonuclease